MQRLHLYRISTNRLCSPMIDRYGAIYHHFADCEVSLQWKFDCYNAEKMLSETKQTI